MLSCAAESHLLAAEWAATNPVAFYGLTELACRRTPCAVGLPLAALWFKAPDIRALTRRESQQQQEHTQQQRSQQQQQQQEALLKTWPEYKAYIFAVASWCKAHVKLYPDTCQAALRGNKEEDFNLSEALALLLRQSNEADGAGCLGLGQAPGTSTPTLQAVRLVLLLWLTRATLGLIKCNLRTAAAQRSSSSKEGGSSSSREGGSSSSAGGGTYGGACRPADTSSSSRRISTATMLFSTGVAVEKHMVAFTLPVLHALLKWQKTTSEITARSSMASSSAAAAAVADVSCLTTRKRLSRLPLQGLPEAVTTQLDKCSNLWR